MKLHTTKAIEERFFKFIKSQGMITEGNAQKEMFSQRGVKKIRMGIGVSGGPDSVCLALLIKRYQKQLHIDPVVIHINHHLRGKESDRDEQFVKEFSKDVLGFKFVKYDINLTKKELHGNSLEAIAREKRYKIFENCIHSLNLNIIALAHTMNDNAETVLINMLRGTGITGICGIPPARDGFVRPILGLSRDNVLDYLKQKDIKYVIDSTNELSDYLRNRIRHEIIPNLIKLNPNFLNHTLALSIDLREIDIFITRIAQQAYRDVLHKSGKGMILLRLKKLLTYDNLIIKMILQIAIKNILSTYYNPRREHIDFIMDMLGNTNDNSKCLDMFPENLIIYKNKEYLILDKRDKP